MNFEHRLTVRNHSSLSFINRLCALIRFSLAKFLPLLVTAFVLDARAEIVRIDGSDFFIEAPDGFVRADTFAGLQQVETSSSIVVNEVAAAFDTVVASLSPDRLVLEGILVSDSTRFESGGRPALLQHLEHDISGIPFHKWQLVIGDSLRTLIVTASFPAWAAGKMSEPLEASLRSANWMRSAQEQLFYDLPFTLKQTDDLKFVKRAPNTIVLADLAQTGELTGRSPSIVVGYLHSDDELVDRPAIAHRQLHSMKGIRDIEILEEGATTVDGIGAYVIRAKARLSGSK